MTGPSGAGGDPAHAQVDGVGDPAVPAGAAPPGSDVPSPREVAVAQRADRVVQRILRSGSLVFTLLVAVGVALVLAADEARAPALRLASLFHARHAAIIVAGVGVLLVGLTPILRVVALLVLWARQHDRRFTLSAIRGEHRRARRPRRRAHLSAPTGRRPLAARGVGPSSAAAYPSRWLAGPAQPARRNRSKRSATRAGSGRARGPEDRKVPPRQLLPAVLPHRTIDLGQQLCRHLEDQLGAHPDEVVVEGGMVDLAQREPVWHHRLAPGGRIRQDVRRVQQVRRPQPTDRAAPLVGPQDPSREERLVQPLLGQAPGLRTLGCEQVPGVQVELTRVHGEDELLARRILGEQADRVARQLRPWRDPAEGRRRPPLAHRDPQRPVVRVLRVSAPVGLADLSVRRPANPGRLLGHRGVLPTGGGVPGGSQRPNRDPVRGLYLLVLDRPAGGAKRAHDRPAGNPLGATSPPHLPGRASRHLRGRRWRSSSHR